jgi:hypothetical protein
MYNNNRDCLEFQILLELEGQNPKPYLGVVIIQQAKKKGSQFFFKN